MNLNVPVAILSLGCVLFCFVFEHRGENCFGVCCNPPLRRTRVKLEKLKMKRKLSYGVHFQLPCFTKGSSF